MNKLWIPVLGALTLSGCTGEKGGSLSTVYCITMILSLILLVGYLLVMKVRNRWFLVLFSSVLVVNAGYFLLSVSQNLDFALHANRISYLGSVFLPMSMLRIILETVNIPVKRWVSRSLVILGILVFLVAASPGILDVYYSHVDFERANGVSRLIKEYGPLHNLYMVYLVGYFAAMVTAIVNAVLKDRVASSTYAVILAAAVFVNIGVWLSEQFVKIEFEILSVSYIISESFLLGLHKLMAEQDRLKAQLKSAPQQTESPLPADQVARFTAGLQELTQTERLVYNCYTEGLTTAQILEKLNIKENTLKFHNKNLYGKLGVSSRKQLVEIQKRLP